MSRDPFSLDPQRRIHIRHPRSIRLQRLLLPSSTIPPLSPSISCTARVNDTCLKVQGPLWKKIRRVGWTPSPGTGVFPCESRTTASSVEENVEVMQSALIDLNRNSRIMADMFALLLQEREEIKTHPRLPILSTSLISRKHDSDLKMTVSRSIGLSRHKPQFCCCNMHLAIPVRCKPRKASHDPYWVQKLLRLERRNLNLCSPGRCGGHDIG